MVVNGKKPVARQAFSSIEFRFFDFFVRGEIGRALNGAVKAVLERIKITVAVQPIPRRSGNKKQNE